MSGVLAVQRLLSSALMGMWLLTVVLLSPMATGDCNNSVAMVDTALDPVSSRDGRAHLPSWVCSQKPLPYRTLRGNWRALNLHVHGSSSCPVTWTMRT
jgi:hypothetical protein